MGKLFTCLGLSVAMLQLFSTCLSQSRSSTCRECNRSPAECRRISGLYTVTVLTEGTYNPVVEIPAPACNINITEFAPSSNYIGVRTVSGQGIINAYWGLGQPGQYYGAGVPFSYDKGSAACKGACIYSEGPTTEAIVIQILYYDKNPGIAYEFTLPNNVLFTPLDGAISVQSSTANPAASPPSMPAIRFQQPHHRRRHQHHHDTAAASDTSQFEGEYYTGSQNSRSEGRPDITAPLEAHIDVRRIPPDSAPGYDYTGSSYGSHTLGGRGMSYTQVADTIPQRKEYIDRQTGRHIVERYRSRTPQVIRKISSPQYLPEKDQRGYLSYPEQPQYQSFSARTSYFNEDKGGEQASLNVGRGQNLGDNQYRWKISGLTECSQTCGGGVQRTNIVCISVSGRIQVVVTPENCANQVKPNVQKVECNTSPCEPAWEAEEWSECSVTCGSGTQTRTVECQQRFSQTLTLRVSADQCGQSEKPAVAQQCEKGLCTTWKTGPWRECSKECGGGQRQRSVRCVDQYDSQIPVGYCSGTAPWETESCNTQPCNRQWWISEWSAECSESCGQGFRTRVALCANSNGEVVSNSSCDSRDLPSLQQACRSDAGCHGIWFAGTWDKCSAECGEGRRSRQVVCLRHSGFSSLLIATDNECDASLKPESEESCTNTQCNAQWYTSPWSECSVTCGEGFRTRDIRCIENNQQQSLRCLGSLKPDSREACTVSSCPSRNQRTKTNRGRSAAEFSLAYTRNRDDDVTEDRKDNVGEKEENNDNGKPCKDTYWNCLMVIQARLCLYPYYRSLCCQSCKNV